MSKGKLLVISGPSGVGKGTIVKELLKVTNARLSVSCTTRPPRDGEVNGKQYFFLSEEEFEGMIKAGGFLEYSKHFDNYYGTPAAFVREMLEEGDVILEIEVDGAMNVKAAMPSAVLVMIAPPDREALFTRLRTRGTEDEDDIKSRVDRADYELSKTPRYDYVVINDDLKTAVEEVLNILQKGDRK